MLILADSSTMKIRVGLIGGPWLQQLTPLQDSGLNVPQFEDEAGRPIHHGDILASHLCKLSQDGPWSSPPACERPPQRRDASLPLSAAQARTTHHPLSTYVSASHPTSIKGHNWEAQVGKEGSDWRELLEVSNRNAKGNLCAGAITLWHTMKQLKFDEVKRIL